MNEITLEKLRTLCHDDTIRITQHLTLRCRERKIRFADIKHAIMTGELIETYPDDFPQPSCLILGKTVSGNPLHVVVGVENSCLWLITAYYPDSDNWEPDLKTRKGQQR
ncbi:MAG: DUF4258 domain-containing protein [Oscillospiraceae bacterium]|nr:DUF4258 domain-containing protein [Oscillospiraceae bacterium]